jgi:hypothetical protein
MGPVAQERGGLTMWFVRKVIGVIVGIIMSGFFVCLFSTFLAMGGMQIADWGGALCGIIGLVIGVYLIVQIASSELFISFSN